MHKLEILITKFVDKREVFLLLVIKLHIVRYFLFFYREKWVDANLYISIPLYSMEKRYEMS